MPSSFDVKRETVEKLIHEYKMKIPDFQRKFVWNDSKKRELIDSLIRNYPIGALTLYNNKIDQVYMLVDGLQRYNTMCLYLNNPSSILKFNDYYNAANYNKELTCFCTENGFDEKKLKKCIRKWYEDLETNNSESKTYDFEFENMKKLNTVLKEYRDDFSDFDKFQKIRDILLKVIDIRQNIIALIVYEGDKDDLPDLFTKINQKNVSLTPYEILHSIWYEYTIPSEYNGYNFKSEFEKSIDDESFTSNADRTIDQFNVYMYLVALGRISSSDILNKKIKNNADKMLINKIRINGELIFDAFSTVTEGKSNKIATVIDNIFKNNNAEMQSKIVFEIGDKLLKSVKALNHFISQNELNYISSKYFYLYLLFIIYKSDCFYGELPFTLDFVDSINKANWFKDKFRQVSFFDARVNDLTDDCKEKFYLDDENEKRVYHFEKNEKGQLNHLVFKDKSLK